MTVLHTNNYHCFADKHKFKSRFGLLIQIVPLQFQITFECTIETGLILTSFSLFYNVCNSTWACWLDELSIVFFWRSFVFGSNKTNEILAADRMIEAVSDSYQTVSVIVTE